MALFSSISGTSNKKSKIVVHHKVGGRLSIDVNEFPANGEEICIKLNPNGILTIKKDTADQDTGWFGTEKKDDDAQDSKNKMEKLLSTLKNALQDHKIASIINPDYRPVMEGAIEEANQFLQNLNPDAKKDEVDDMIKMVEMICEPLISSLIKSNALSTSITTTFKRVRTHFNHWDPEHEFKWVEGSGTVFKFNCEGCKQDDWGKRYECSSCSGSFFHEECMEAKPTAFNDFIGANFELLAEPKGKGFKSCPCDSCRRKCDACGKLMEGMVYYCEEEDMALHPLCFKLEREISANGVSFYLRDNMAKKACACCGRKKVGSSYSSSIHGWSYVSKDEELHIHVSCAMEMVSEYTKKGLRSVNNNNKEVVVLKEKELFLENKKHKKGYKFLKIMFSVLQAIVGMLLGDPITPLLIFVADQVFNL